ncbi:hepcidin [Arapaima gigas]
MNFLRIVAVILSICVLLAAASPLSETQMQEDDRGDIREGEQRTTEAAEKMSPSVLFRSKRQSHLSMCRICCKCCNNKGCGFCCKF